MTEAARDSEQNADKGIYLNHWRPSRKMTRVLAKQIMLETSSLPARLGECRLKKDGLEVYGWAPSTLVGWSVGAAPSCDLRIWDSGSHPFVIAIVH